MSPLNVRRVTRRGFEKSLQWCETKGVRVFRDAEILDAQADGNDLHRIEIRSENWSGNVSGHQFVWQLTSDETYHFSVSIGNILFPTGRVRSMWSWVRYRIQLQEAPTLSSLPNQFVMINDLYLPLDPFELVNCAKQ
ncbi:MAG: hypothetical protein R2827_11245 [Bdellovibrionales bacterium]